MKNKEEIISRFHAIKDLGFVKSKRSNNTGIGKTFEDYIGVVENNLDEPDLLGFEIKSHREEASSYVTLFTKAPEFPKGANAILTNEYGTPYENTPSIKKLHTSMFATRFNTHESKYSFKLINDREAKLLRIGIYDLNSKKLINDCIGYTYNTLEKILKKKLNNLFYVSAERKFEGEDEYFFFNKAEVFTGPSFEKFLYLIDKGLVMFDIRIGSYKTGRNMGKPHDHGSCFRMIESNIKLLYEEHEVIE